MVNAAGERGEAGREAGRGGGDVDDMVLDIVESVDVTCFRFGLFCSVSMYVCIQMMSVESKSGRPFPTGENGQQKYSAPI